MVRPEQSINCADCGIFACPLVPTAAIFPSLDKHYAVAYRLFRWADIDCPTDESQVRVRRVLHFTGSHRKESCKNWNGNSHLDGDYILPLCSN